MRDVVDEIFVTPARRSHRADLRCRSSPPSSIRGLATYGQAVILAKVGNNLVARYQQRLFDHLMKLGVGFFSETRSGQLAAQINQNVVGIRDLLEHDAHLGRARLRDAGRAGRRDDHAGSRAVG